MDSSRPPIVTLDAGPNVHIIVETSTAEEWRLALNKEFPGLKILHDTQGHGAVWSEGGRFNER